MILSTLGLIIAFVEIAKTCYTYMYAYRAFVHGMMGTKINLNLQWILQNTFYLNTPWHPQSKSHIRFILSLLSSQNLLQITLPHWEQLSCDKTVVISLYLVIKSCFLQCLSQI